MLIYFLPGIHEYDFVMVIKKKNYPNFESQVAHVLLSGFY